MELSEDGPGLRTDVTLPDINPNIRLHVNAGHPSNQRRSASNTSPSSTFAVDHAFGSQGDSPPRAASMPAFTGQFGERIRRVWPEFPAQTILLGHSSHDGWSPSATPSSWTWAMTVASVAPLRNTWKRRPFTTTASLRRRTVPAWHTPSGATPFHAPWPSA